MYLFCHGLQSFEALRYNLSANDVQKNANSPSAQTKHFFSQSSQNISKSFRKLLQKVAFTDTCSLFCVLYLTKIPVAAGTVRNVSVS